MSDIARLLEHFKDGALLRPSSDVPNLVDLARALAHLAGADRVECTARSHELEQVIGSSDHLVLVVADGLGMAMVEEQSADTFIATNLVGELRTVFPSTTAVALTTLATAAWPNQHGVTGQWTHLPEIQAAAALLPFTHRSGGRSLARLGIAAEHAFLLPSVATSIRRTVRAIFPAQIANSVSAAYFSGNRDRLGFRTITQAVHLIQDAIETADAPTYTYLYLPRIDLEAHRHGTRHPAVQAAIAELDHAIGSLANRLQGRARIVLTGDHGLVDTPVAARHWLRPTPELFELLRCPPSGDTRVMYLHLREGTEDRVRELFRKRYGNRFFVLSIDEAEECALFGPGPLAPVTRSRLGDLVVISAGPDAIEYVPSGGIDRSMAIVAHHSGLAADEMRVPLIVA